MVCSFLPMELIPPFVGSDGKVRQLSFEHGLVNVWGIPWAHFREFFLDFGHQVHTQIMSLAKQSLITAIMINIMIQRH